MKLTIIIGFLAAGILYLGLSVLTFFRPYFILRTIYRLEIKWSEDVGVFSSSKTARFFIGALFVLTSVVALFSTCVLIFG